MTYPSSDIIFPSRDGGKKYGPVAYPGLLESDGGTDLGLLVVPVPGFVLKAIDTGSCRKVFINVCHSLHVLAPKPEPGKGVRVPISIGPICADMDKKGNACNIVDVVASEDCVKNAMSDELFSRDFCSIVMDSVSKKYSLQFANVKMLKLQYKGTHVRPQRIRQSKSDLILDESPGKSNAACTPEFSFEMIDSSNGASLDLLSEHPPDALATRYTSVRITIPNVNHRSTTLKLCRERLVVCCDKLSSFSEWNVCHPLLHSPYLIDMVPCQGGPTISVCDL